MFDLHVHSTHSDGTLAPAALVKLAIQSQIHTFALTDHDTCSGLAEAIKASKSSGVKVIPGIELSVAIEKGTFHLLGYYINPDNAVFRETLQLIQIARQKRNPRIVEALNKLGIKISLQDAVNESGGGQLGRVHFARTLVHKGWVATIHEAFERYLAKGRPAYFPKALLAAEEGIALIKQAGGVAVIAHPFSLELSPEDLDAFLGRLKKLGLAGLEVYYPMHTPAQIALYAQLADKHHLVKTAGTDFHGENKAGIILGQGLAALGCKNNPVAELETLL